MELGLRGRRALVTGSSRGLGKAIAQALAREGARVALCARSVEQLTLLAQELDGNNADHCIIPIDLTEEGAPEALVGKLDRLDFGRPEIIVHNLGGTLNISDPFCSLEDWRRVMRFNFEVPVELNRLLVPRMQEQRWGRVVHISSIAGMENQGPVTYCAAKAALTAYTRSFGGVVAPDGVVVSAILPGAFYTEGGYWDWASKERPDHVHKFLTERQRIRRFGRPEEVGNFVAFLCSNLASFSTGSIMPIDGGQGRGYFGQ